MKTTKVIGIIIVIILIINLLTNCNQLKLENQEAKQLIIKALNLPQSYRKDIGSFTSSTPLDELQNEGLINYSFTYWGINTDLNLNATEKGKPYYLGQDSKTGNYMFKTNDIDFNEITGIAVNKDQQTATIRFSLIATNVTPVAKALKRVNWISYDINAPINGELVFKKFDNGWQLQSEQNESSIDLLNKIIMPSR